MTSHSSSGKILHGTASSVSLDPQAYGSWVPGVSAPAAVAGAAGQEAQDAATIYSLGYVAYDMSSVFQQQHCQVAFARGTPWTLGTPVGHPRYTRLYSYSPEISSTSTSTSTAGGLQTTVVQPVMTSNAGQQDNGSHSSRQHGGMEPQPSQHRGTDWTKASESWPTDFTLDSSMVHHYGPVEINQTTDLDQMPESLLEHDYELFQQAVWSSMGKFRLSADYAEYMDEKAGIWYFQEILIETRSLWKPRLQSKQLSHIAPGSLRVSSLPRILWILR